MVNVAGDLVEKAGISIDQLLVKNAAAGLTTYRYHTLLLFNLIGLEGIKEIAETARFGTASKHSFPGSTNRAANSRTTW
jgi:ferritin-like protein